MSILNPISVRSGVKNSVQQWNVALGTTSSILDNQFVMRAPGASVVAAAVPASTVIGGADLLVGLAQGASTETVAVAGIVNVTELDTTVVYEIPADASIIATIATQAGYNGLIGKRVNYAVTANAVTCLGVDAATNPLVIQPFQIVTRPGFIAVKVRMEAMNNF